MIFNSDNFCYILGEASVLKFGVQTICVKNQRMGMICGLGHLTSFQKFWTPCNGAVYTKFYFFKQLMINYNF